MNLPKCDFRSDHTNVRFKCSHPKVHSDLVTEGTCRSCPFSKEPDFQEKNPLPKRDCGPGLIRLAANFAQAVVKHAANGFEKVAEATYKARLAKCDTCEFRNGNRCKHMACGCYLPEKAMWASEKCPIGKWPDGPDGV